MFNFFVSCFLLISGVNLYSQNSPILDESIRKISSNEKFDFFNHSLDSVQIVGLGEVSHYTKECYQYKKQLIQQLVEKLKFNRIVFEVDYGEAKKWNDYILSGKGDLDSILSSCGWWTYKTESFKSILMYLKEHNSSTTHKVKVYGMEMTYLKHNIDLIKSYVTKYYPNNRDLLNDLKIERKYLAFTTHASKEILDYWSLYYKLSSIINKHENSMKIPEEERNELIRLVEIIKQYCTYVSQNEFFFQTELRDKFSFQNVNWVLRNGANNKIIIWAHNGHIRRNYYYDQLGRNLHKQYGNRYFSIGFSFGKGELGSFNADWKFKKWTFELTKLSSFNNQLYNLNIGDAFINIRDFSNSTNYRRPLMMREDLGEQILERNFNSTAPIVLSNTYDAMIFIKTSTYPIKLN